MLTRAILPDVGKITRGTHLLAKICVAGAAAVAFLGLAACSSSSPGDDTSDGTRTLQTPRSMPSPTRSALSDTPASASRAGLIACAELAGTLVPRSLDAVKCAPGRGVADVAKQSYRCPGGGVWFWLSPESTSGEDLASVVGRPGGRWIKVSPDADSERLGKLAGCR